MLFLCQGCNLVSPLTFIENSLGSTQVFSVGSHVLTSDCKALDHLSHCGIDLWLRPDSSQLQLPILDLGSVP